MSCTEASVHLIRSPLDQQYMRVLQGSIGSLVAPGVHPLGSVELHLGYNLVDGYVTT